VEKQGTKNWRAIRGDRPLNEDMLALYRQLMEAEVRLAEDSYLAALARDLATRGGHLEVLAVLPDETLTLLREPPDPASEPPAPGD
jgi:hypothetical protein